MPQDLLILDVRPAGGQSADVLIRDGQIAAVGTIGAADGAAVLDGGGALLLPGLVEAHTHLDKTLWGMGWHKHSAGPRLIDKIENERRIRRETGIDPDRQSARQVAQSLRMGTTHIRSHVDVDTEVGLAGIEGVMAMRERLKAVIDVQIVAFPQSGLLIRPGTLELLDRAMALGAEVVGGLDPCAIDRDPKGHLDAIFGLAEKHGRPLDIHLHEPGEMGAFSLELIIERTRAHGMQGKVTVSHGFCLGMPDVDQARRLIADLARERIAVMTTGPASRPAPPVKQCVEAGIVVCGGSDGIRDSWNPYGNGDMLERAMLIGLRNNFRLDEEIELALDVCSHGGATVMGLDSYGLAVGCAADLLLVPGDTPAEAVVARPADRTVIKRGKVVVRNGELTEPVA
ncbi:amidohydrolase family protein [Phreatobacter stygius]|uniref:Cytosine deaminase n=1 Tax=Phreatobacter stygius TaxID=1940610 RepID=A0A4D7AW78_9HYPH|nr:amidohydrolase family protein [Phreatobacter stygius]QCI63233.1 cytosine deaminase [Phreatobacter stygius]